MAALTEARNTKELRCGALIYNYEIEVASGSRIYAGAMAAVNAAGKAVPASDAAGLVVLGRAEATVAGGLILPIRRGVYLYGNGTSTEALTRADIGRICFVVDDQTVGKAGGTNRIPAGLVLDVTDDGVAVAMDPSAGHVHAIADVTGLQTALDGKAAAMDPPAGHVHAIADVTGLQAALDGKADQA